MEAAAVNHKARCGEGPDINIDEMESMLCHIYHGAKKP